MTKCAAGFLIFRRICDQVEYLLLKASYGSHHWTPPKGHVDPGEDNWQTALRETFEEAGYTETDLKVHKNLSQTLEYNVKGEQKIVIYWLAELINPKNDPKLSEEHEAFKWLSKDEAKHLSGYKDFANMIDYFHDTIGDLK